MPWYRNYPLNCEGHFIGSPDFESAEDANAMAIISLLSKEADYVVWLDSRHLGRVSGKNKGILFPGRG